MVLDQGAARCRAPRDAIGGRCPVFAVIDFPQALSDLAGPDALAAVFERMRFGGRMRGEDRFDHVRNSLRWCHDVCPRRSPQPSRHASARSSPSATSAVAPAWRSAVMQATCLSVAPPPSAFCLAVAGPLWAARSRGRPWLLGMAKRWGARGRAPGPLKIAARMGLRSPPFAGWKANTPGAPRARRCWKTAR